MRQNGRIELVSDYLTEAVIVKQKHKFESAWRVAKTGGANFRLHPLIHTSLEFSLVLDFENKKSGASESEVLFEISI